MSAPLNPQCRMAPKSSGCYPCGLWERLVSIIKRAFSLNLGSDRLSRDVFATIAAESESILISRPLTHVSSELDDDLSLTPNHFLMGRPFVYAPAAAFYEASTCKLSNKSWKRARERLDSFWRHLLKEYAPTLIRRTKCTQPEEPLGKITSCGYSRTLHYEASGPRYFNETSGETCPRIPKKRDLRPL